jgi:hypothetical protein
MKIPREKAWEWANTRKGCWSIAGSWILTTTFTNSYLETVGFPKVLRRYEELRARTKRLEMIHGTC